MEYVNDWMWEPLEANWLFGSRGKELKNINIWNKYWSYGLGNDLVRTFVRSEWPNNRIHYSRLDGAHSSERIEHWNSMPAAYYLSSANRSRKPFFTGFISLPNFVWRIDFLRANRLRLPIVQKEKIYKIAQSLCVSNVQCKRHASIP